MDKKGNSFKKYIIYRAFDYLLLNYISGNKFADPDIRKVGDYQLISKIFLKYWNLGLIIFLVILGEYLIFLNRLGDSTMVYSVNLIAIIFSGYYRKELIYLGLLLVSIFRITNLAMFVFGTHVLYYYFLTYCPMAFSILFILKNKKNLLVGLNLRREVPRYYLPLGLILGLFMGLLEYQILYETILSEVAAFRNFVIITIMIMILVAFVEEFIFRSVLQTGLEEQLGPMKGLLVASLLSGMTYSGYSVFSEIAFASFTGLIFGFIFQKTKNLTLVTLIHAFANVSLFLIAPILQGQLIWLQI